MENKFNLSRQKKLPPAYKFPDKLFNSFLCLRLQGIFLFQHQAQRFYTALLKLCESFRSRRFQNRKEIIDKRLAFLSVYSGKPCLHCFIKCCSCTILLFTFYKASPFCLPGKTVVLHHTFRAAFDENRLFFMSKKRSYNASLGYISFYFGKNSLKPFTF